MRLKKLYLRLIFLFSCMLPRRSADALGYMSFIFFFPFGGLSWNLEVILTGHIHIMRNLVITVITYLALFLSYIFLTPYSEEQRHINRLVFKCRYRFLYAILALLVSAVCIVSLPLLMNL